MNKSYEEFVEKFPTYEVPEGWLVELVPYMIDMLYYVFRSAPFDIEVLQLKEKYGKLLLYYSIGPNEDVDWDIDDEVWMNISKGYVEFITNYCQDRSWKTCAMCGRPATQHSSGYILPFCDNCFKEYI